MIFTLTFASYIVRGSGHTRIKSVLLPFCLRVFNHVHEFLAFSHIHSSPKRGETQGIIIYKLFQLILTAKLPHMLEVG